MKLTQRSLQSPLGRVRGLGSAHSGTHHFWMQRTSAMSLVILVLYLGYGFYLNVLNNTYMSAFLWVHHPLVGACMIGFIIMVMYHGTLGVENVIQDYVHCDSLKLASLLAVKLIASLFVILGITAVLHIQLASAIAHV